MTIESFSSIPWIYFALASAAFYSVTNFIEKYLVEKKIKDPLIITIFSGLTSLILGIIILAFKGFQVIETVQLILILISGIFLVFYLIPYLKALELDDASKVVPLLQFSPIFVLVLSYIFLGEALTSKQLLGVALIIVGGFALGAERIEKGIFTSRKSFWLMVLASFLFAITGVLFKFVVITQDFWLTLAYESIGMGIGAFILLLWSAYRSSFRQETKKIKLDTFTLLSVNQCFSVLAQLTVSYAFVLSSAALVSAIGGVQSFFVLLFGLILSIWFPRIIQEKIDKITILTKIISIFSIFIGVYLVYI
jgi:uncharacterized membrane protein